MGFSPLHLCLRLEYTTVFPFLRFHFFLWEITQLLQSLMSPPMLDSRLKPFPEWAFASLRNYRGFKEDLFNRDFYSCNCIFLLLLFKCLTVEYDVRITTFPGPHSSFVQLKEMDTQRSATVFNHRVGFMLGVQALDLFPTYYSQSFINHFGLYMMYWM